MSSSVDKNELIWEVEEVKDMGFVSDEDEDEDEDETESETESESEEEEEDDDDDEDEDDNDANFRLLGQQLEEELNDPFGDRKSNVPAQKHKIRNRLLPPPKVTLPPILLSEDMSSDILDAFYQSATDKVTSDIWMSLNPRRDLKILRNAAKPDPRFLVFVPIGQDDKKSHLILRAKDLYKVGYEIEGHHYILDFKVESEVDQVTKALLSLGVEKEYTTEVRGAMVDYPVLEALAKKQRHQLWLGRKSLIQHFNMLFIQELEKNLSLVSRVVLFFTQIVCEALRIFGMRDHILSSFSLGRGRKAGMGVKTPKRLVILQHGWAMASKRLQMEVWGVDGFEVKVHVNDDVIDIPVLFTMFTCLRFYTEELLRKIGKLPVPVGEIDRVMAVKYQGSEKSRQNKLMEIAQKGRR